jgi:hypothetical protein
MAATSDDSDIKTKPNQISVTVPVPCNLQAYPMAAISDNCNVSSQVFLLQQQNEEKM